MSRAVILFKSPPRNPDNDPYILSLTAAEYTPYFVEVLDFTFANEDSLVNVLQAGPEQDALDGVAITSSRGAEAWIHALNNSSEVGDWSQIPFYVVGEATARPLRQMTRSHPTKFSESLILGAAQTGKAESLAQFILDDLPARRRGKKLLYLTGDKNRDTFHRILTENGVNIQSLMVYGTMAAKNLGQKVFDVVQEIRKLHASISTWLVFFAPSSSGYVLPHLAEYFALPSLETSTDSLQTTLSPSKLAAIGTTTSDYLRSERKLRISAVPSQPTPEKLTAALCESDRGNNLPGP
ncbi:hypothetical protein M422DRAFT_181486 [Sphaerobolus stellatus SS14]|uniref:Tetrapyrrole biosynthesis uroporphyrinogen III synthase domain-containing protein n=1 Tax=Sphaerobolus stellatus (strain SS14) TaxID=990650 RepID=A0A0C9TX10_SPHS4|nr:hypothetical protein M422DRAFT_181486 [Sphaerobolus stellatus SS14]